MFIIEKNVSNRKDNNTYYCNQKNGMCTKDIMAKQILPVYKAFLKEKKFMLCRTLILLDQSNVNRSKRIVNELKRLYFNHLYFPIRTTKWIQPIDDIVIKRIFT